MKKLIITGLALLTLGACQMTPGGEEQLAELQQMRAELTEQRTELQETRTKTVGAIEAMTSLVQALGEQIEEGTVDPAEAEAKLAELAAKLAAFEADLAETVEDIGEVEEALDQVDQTEREVIAYDKGQQASSWMQLIGAVVAATGTGGVAGKILTGLGKSRAQGAVDEVNKELNALKLALAAIENSPSRASEEVGELRAVVAGLQATLNAANAGYQTPPIHVTNPPGGYTGPGDTVPPTTGTGPSSPGWTG